MESRVVRTPFVSSFNRNFPGRNDGISETLSFLASPEVVTAYAITGDLGFDPVNQSVKGRWEEFKLQPPVGRNYQPRVCEG